ncbi:MAG: hypothetical protein AB7P76_08430 [Candidatus Melainabacteria bacterium]
MILPLNIFHAASLQFAGSSSSSDEADDENQYPEAPRHPREEAMPPRGRRRVLTEHPAEGPRTRRR